MPAHSIGSATISFGLVSVPIKMFSAGESCAAISFNWLHKKDGSRLKQQYFCSKDGENVEKEDMIKGYEFSKGRYVQFTTDELKALEEKGTGSINITEFVDADTVDRMYMDKVYFMGPEKGGDRAFTLLGEALKKTRKVAIGQWAARGKQYLVMIRPLGRGLAMEQLRYANEVRSIDEVPIPKVDVKKAELDMAVQLVEQAASEKFEPQKYEDTVKMRIQEQIQRKVDGEEITEEPTEAPKTQIIDLMEALKASLAKGKGSTGGERKPAKRVERAAEVKPEETKGGQRVGDDGLHHRGSRTAPRSLSGADSILHPSRFPLPLPRARRGGEGGVALLLSGLGAAAGREGADGGPDPRGEDPQLAAPADAAAAAGTSALGAAHHG